MVQIITTTDSQCLGPRRQAFNWMIRFFENMIFATQITEQN